MTHEEGRKKFFARHYHTHTIKQIQKMWKRKMKQRKYVVTHIPEVNLQKELNNPRMKKYKPIFIQGLSIAIKIIWKRKWYR